MRTIRRPFTVSCLATLLAAERRRRRRRNTVAIDNDDIGGTVNGPAGPEAGVWVIAETDDFDTRYAKIVVTDDQGRYVVPDLPPANYQVWVRGYGLVDSTKVAGRPGQTLNLVANAAPSPAAAAVVYPAAYWYSMMKVPSAERGQLAAGRRQSISRVGQESLVHRLPSDRPARDAHATAGVREHEPPRRVGAAHPVGSSRRADARRRR